MHIHVGYEYSLYTGV